MTPFEQHVASWKDCRNCPLWETRKRVVFARGSVPAHVLFVGEAPGESENVLGKPFVGPAGKLLDHIIGRSLPEGVKFAMTNLVACIPRDRESGGKAAEPEVESLESCAPRLQEFVKICSPQLIVCVGKLARDWLDPRYKGGVNVGGQPQVHIEHPAYILRQNMAHRGFLVQRYVVTVKNAVDKHVTL